MRGHEEMPKGPRLAGEGDVLGRPVFLALALSVAAVPASALAADCAPVVASEGTTNLPKAWRAAIEELRSATAQPGKPWSCVGGSVELALNASGGGTLRVRTADGVTIERQVDGPEDVAPLGEAMLAKPEARPVDPVDPVDPPAKPIDEPPPADPSPMVQVKAPTTNVTAGSSASVAPDAVDPAGEERPDPRVIVAAMIAPRYAGKSDLAMGSAEVSVGVPIARWVPGVWFRFDGPLDVDKHDIPFVEACIGGSFGRVFSASIVDITPSLTGSAAIQVEDPPQHQKGDVRVDARVGANVRVALPRKSLVRAAFSADFEIAPAQVDDDRHGQDDPTVPEHARLPAYTLGLGVGVELAPR